MNKIINLNLPLKVVHSIISSEFTRLLIMKEDNGRPVLIHTSYMDNKTMSMNMEHYPLYGNESFIKVFNSNQINRDIYVVDQELLNDIDSGNIGENQLMFMIDTLNQIYEAMDNIPKTVTEYIPPIRIMGVGEEKEEGN